MPLREEAVWVREVFRDKYAALLNFLVTRLPHRADAEDLAQEAFLRLLRVPQADLIRQPDAYLFRIAANLVLEFRLRARRSRVSFDSEWATSAAETADLADTPSPAEQLLDARSLERVIEALPVRCRTALVLQRRDGLTYAQIAQKLGVSPDMVKKYLASAIARCRVALGEEP
ncbi:MAG: RNA polymerase sigma factor [Gammaproteobacteria bacterium]